MQIFSVDDGCVYNVMAENQNEAKDRWHQYMVDCGHTETEIASDFGEPEIMLVVLSRAAGIMITEDASVDCSRCASCPECNGSGIVPKETSLLDLFRAELLLPEHKRASNGILSCSEW